MQTTGVQLIKEPQGGKAWQSAGKIGDFCDWIFKSLGFVVYVEKEADSPLQINLKTCNFSNLIYRCGVLI